MTASVLPIHRLLARVVMGMCVVSCLVLPVRAEDDPTNPGLKELDQATELHLKARTLKDLEKVIELSESALEIGLDDDNAQLARHLAASCLYQRGSSIAGAIVDRQRPNPRWEQLREIALGDLVRAVDYHPDLGEAQQLICKLCLLPGGDAEQGLAAATEVIRIYANDKSQLAEGYTWRARFQTDPDQQLADLKSATEADPNYLEAWQMLAAAQFERGEFQQAGDAFRRLIDQQPENATLRLALAEVLANLEDKYDEALEQIELAIELEPMSTQGYLLRSRLRASREDVEGALADLDEALAINASDVTALLIRAELYLFQDKLQDAREDIDRALQARPGLVMGIILRSRIAAAEKRYRDAIRDIELLVQNDPQNMDFRLQLAAFYNADDRPRKAIEVLSGVLEEDSDNWRALRSRGDARLSIGAHAEAIEDYERALKIQPEDSGLLNNLAWVLATSPEDEIRDGQRALELATKACELTDYLEAHILSTLASTYAELGDFETAIKWSEKSVELGEGDVKEQLEQELESYKEEKPWREKQETKEKVELPQGNLLET
jgi:tetratricopeptide (TPR) repeat protein